MRGCSLYNFAKQLHVWRQLLLVLIWWPQTAEISKTIYLLHMRIRGWITIRCLKFRFVIRRKQCSFHQAGLPNNRMCHWGDLGWMYVLITNIYSRMTAAEWYTWETPSAHIFIYILVCMKSVRVFSNFKVMKNVQSLHKNMIIYICITR